jgi:PAS domain S-box-containing protein
MKKSRNGHTENDGRLEAILRTIPDLLFHMDHQGKFLSFYQDEIAGLVAKPGEFIGKTVEEIFEHQLSEKFLHAIKQTLIHGKFEHEYELYADGLKYFSAKYAKVNENEVVSLVRDITKPKETESKIRFLYKQQKLLADISQRLNSSSNLELALDDVLMLLGQHTGISRVYIFEDVKNGAATTNTYEWCNTGISPQIQDLQEIPYEIIPSWKKILMEEGRVFSTNIKELPADIFEILEPQGIKSILIYPLYVQSSFFGFIGFDECIKNKTWANDEINLLQTISNIISNAFERRQVLKKLEESELRLKMAIEGAQEGLWDWNNETGEVYFSDTWCRMLDYEPDEIEANVSSWEKLVNPDDMKEVMEALTRHLNGETEFYESVHRVKTKGGTWKWILDRGMVVQRNHKNEPARTIGTHIDISKQKETEQQLKDSIDTRNKLFSIIAHDLRGPISNFLPALEILTGDNDLDDITKKEFLTGLKKASITTFNLLENLLNWSRLHTNTIRMEPSDFIINDVILNIIELLSSSAKHKSITVSLNANERYSVYADKESVHLIIRNLLSNALKFTHKNGKIAVSVNNIKNKIEVEVADNGTGMEQNVVASIFKSKSFFSTYGTNSEKGSGLGLLLCREFVEKNEGEIRAESTPGTGSRFFFTLNRGKLPEENLPIEKETVHIDKEFLRNRRILVVEDEQFNQFFIQALLRQWNVITEIAENGKVAVSLLQQKPYDLILMDVEMPEMDGYTAIQVIRKTLRLKTPVVVVSANTNDEIIQRLTDAGMNEFISKPYDPEVLYSKIVKWLGNKIPADSKQIDEKICNASIETKKLITLSKLYKALGDDRNQIKVMISKFLEISPAYYNEVLSGYENQDYALVKKSSHKIKSSIELLASKGIVNNIRLINQFAESKKDHQKLHLLIVYFRDAFPRLCDELKDEIRKTLMLLQGILHLFFLSML